MRCFTGLIQHLYGVQCNYNGWHIAGRIVAIEHPPLIYSGIHD